MEDIKEILGEQHIIFKITDELIDNSDIDVVTDIQKLLSEANSDPHSSCVLIPNSSDPDILSSPDKNLQVLLSLPDKNLPDKNLQVTKNDLDYELSYDELIFSSKNRSKLPRLMPDWNETLTKKPIQIVFGGCAGMYHYFLGVASVLQDKFDLSNVVYGCVSGGSFPALALVLGLPVKELHETWNKEILRDLSESSLKAFTRLNGIVFEKSKKYIPSDSHKRAKDKLFISLTEFPSLNNHIVHSWQNIDSLLDCIQASCFIPLFDKRFWTIFDKIKYVDGGLSNNKPIPYPDLPYIYITTNKWREVPLHWYWCYTSEIWSDQLFNWGVEDTIKNLHEFKDFTPKA